MKAPDTIYIELITLVVNTGDRLDTDIGYVRADIAFGVASRYEKTIEAQKAEIEDLRDLLASTSLDAGEHIAALQQTVAELRAERERLRDVFSARQAMFGESYGFGYRLTVVFQNREIADSTFSLIAALASPPAAVDPAEAERIHQEGVALANLFRQIQPPRDADPSHICAHGKDAIERCIQCEAAGAFFQPATGDAT